MFKRFITPLIIQKTLFFLILIISTYSYSITNEADVKDFGVNEKLGASLPHDLIFYDENGALINLGDLLLDGKPMIITPVYYSCPRLCSFVLNGLLESLNGISSLSLGEDFKIASISFNRDDKPEIANNKAQKFHGKLNEQHPAKNNWLFLTGDEDNISKLTQSVGFSYKKDGDEFAHPSTLIFITPEGKIARYLYGVQYDPSELRLSLLEASDGKIGSSQLLNKVLLFCYEFDPVGKRYALQALNVVKAGGVITLLSLGGLLIYYWKREKSNNTHGGLKNQ